MYLLQILQEILSIEHCDEGGGGSRDDDDWCSGSCGESHIKNGLKLQLSWSVLLKNSD